MVNAAEGVGWLMMPQLDIAASTVSSLSKIMFNFDTKHRRIERSCSGTLMSMLCIFVSMIISGKADAGQTAVGQPEELEPVMINMTNKWLKTRKHMGKQGCYIFALLLMLSTAASGQYNNNLSH